MNKGKDEYKNQIISLLSFLALISALMSSLFFMMLPMIALKSFKYCSMKCNYAFAYAPTHYDYAKDNYFSA